ncbi:MAG TPA: hypothetical protein VGH91_13835 [Gammaproteobacteria bacterium]|jgi:hypothetical protein
MFAQYSFSRMLPVAALSMLLGLVACGGGGGGGSGSGSTVTPPGGSTSSGTDCTNPTKTDVDGCAYVTLDDVTGDFLVYSVKVTDLSITKSDGTVAEMLPANTTVDFAQYTSLSEFLTLNAVPAGNYVSGSITIDFSGADIETQDSSGNAVKLSPVDSSGKALGSVTLAIKFDSNHTLGLFAGTPHVLGIDFDLNASDVVNSNNTVTVNPFIVASVDTAASVTQQVRGPLSASNSTGDNFTLGLSPFQGGSGDYGDVVVTGTSATTYIVDQKVYTGESGIRALAADGKATAVLAQGSFNFNNHEFVATQVFAGSSVPGGTKDAVEGVVVARSGNTLTLLGSNLYRTSQAVTFHDASTVTVGSSTVVRESDKPQDSKTIADISVGQRILVFGNFASGDSTKLDATSGFALLEFTAVDGSVLSLVDNGDNSSINLNVAAIEDRPISVFDFSNTPTDPTNFEVALPCSCLNTGVDIADPVIVSGFAPAFGTSPPDFSAQALTDFNVADSLVSVIWSGTGTRSAFSSVEAGSGIVVNLGSSPTTANLREGAEVTSLSSLPSVPAAVSKALGIYAIQKDGTVQVYLSFSDFVSALNSDLSSGSHVKGFFAIGGYDSADALLKVTETAVILD